MVAHPDLSPSRRLGSCMKIIYVSTERGWHGGEEQLRLLVEGAERAGHECAIVARRGGEFAVRMRSRAQDVVELAGSVRGLRSMWRMRQVVRSFRPDIVHVNDAHSLTLAKTALWKSGAYGHVAARRVLFPIRSPRRYLVWCDRIVCVSHAIAEVCRQSGIPAAQLRVVHDGVDPERMAQGNAARGRQALGIADDQPLVLCVAQFAPYKGHRYLLEAMPRILQTHPRAVLALAGDGPLREELQAQVAQLGLGAAVLFLGYRQDVPDLIQACDLFVLPSPEEGMGSSLLDAMFAGKAVVGAEAGGISEVLRDAPGLPAAGYLVPPRDPAALAETISEALSDQAARVQFGRAGQARARNGFTAADMVARTLAVYAEILG